MLRAYKAFHSPNAGDFITEILALLDAGKTVILDLGNATDEIRRYFADMLSKAVFAHQESKFVSNKLGSHFVQLYFEEAHNLFPPDAKDLTGVYARFAKEGAKFHLGMVYSTQSPSTINKDLLAQTENFFVGHLSSQDEARSLGRVQVAFEGVEQDILRAKTPGYMRMLTMSHRFIIPVQAHKFEAT
jgi:DNA helicase HerA-like ATPase